MARKRKVLKEKMAAKEETTEEATKEEMTVLSTPEEVVTTLKADVLKSMNEQGYSVDSNAFEGELSEVVGGMMGENSEAFTQRVQAIKAQRKEKIQAVLTEMIGTKSDGD